MTICQINVSIEKKNICNWEKKLKHKLIHWYAIKKIRWQKNRRGCIESKLNLANQMKPKRQREEQKKIDGMRKAQKLYDRRSGNEIDNLQLIFHIYAGVIWL